MINDIVLKDVSIKNRIWEIDFIKGVLIILMVMFHLTGQNPYLSMTVYLFHMPIFLLISGYMANMNKSLPLFFRSLMQIFLPLVWFTIIYDILLYLVDVTLGGVGAELPSFGLILKNIFIKPTGTYWYLQVLFYCMIPYYFFFRILKLEKYNAFIMLSVTVFGISQFTPCVEFGTYCFYLAGVAIRVFGGDLLKVFRATPFAFIPLIIALLYRYVNGSNYMIGWIVLTTMFSLLLWATKYVSGVTRRVIVYIGRNTLPIFLVSPMITGFMKPLYNIINRFDYCNIIFTVVATTLTIVISLLSIKIIEWTKCAKFIFLKDRVIL